MRSDIGRILLRPLLIDLIGFLQFAGNEAVIGGFNVEAFTLTNTAAQLEGFAEVGTGGSCILQVVLRHAQRSVGAGKVGIERHRALVIRNRLGIPLHRLHRAADRVRLQCLQR